MATSRALGARWGRVASVNTPVPGTQFDDGCACSRPRSAVIASARRAELAAIAPVSTGYLRNSLVNMFRR
jgi:hypothetical protein